MDIEKKLVEYIADAKFEDIPEKPLTTVKNIVLGIFGSIAAGAYSTECVSLIGLLKELGGKPEATVLVHGMKLPAHHTALANATMAQSLDYDDAVVPGVHIGCVSVPAAIAAAEISDGCNGRDFLAAVTAGIEFANRLNMINFSTFYGGFHGTGVTSVFAAAAAAAKIMGLGLQQTSDAIGLSLNLAGGSGQNNIEGASAVSLVAGYASQGGIFSARLARRGISGPKRFILGDKGWVSMFGTGQVDTELLIGELGTRYELEKTLFKRFPSCGLTQTSTQGVLEIMKETGIRADDISEIQVRVGPFAKTVVGHFEIGPNPTMSAQFSIPYCVANALLRGSSELSHFEEAQVRDPGIARIAGLVDVQEDPAIEKRDQRAMEMDIQLKSGETYHKRIDIPRGSPGNEMDQEEHIERFRQCASYGRRPISRQDMDHIIALVENLEDLNDIRDVIPLLTV